MYPMNRIIRTLFSITIILTFIYGCSRGKEISHTVKIENGIKAISNNFPDKGIIRLDLTKTLTIDPSKIPQCENAIISDFFHDKAGNVFLVDGRQARIHKFDQFGKYKISFLSKGAGPGEFDPYPEIQISGNLIWVFNGVKLACFNLEGQLLNEYKLTKNYQSLTMIDAHRFIANVRLNLSRTRVKKEAALFALEGEKKAVTFFQSDAYGGKFIPFGKLGIFFLPACGVFPDIITMYNPFSNRVYVSRNDKYEINVYDIKGSLKAVIRSKHDPVSVSERDKTEIMSTLEKAPKNLIDAARKSLPDKLCAIQQIDLLENGDFIVRPIKGINNTDFDIFNREGILLYRLIIPDSIKLSRPKFFRGFLAGIEEREDTSIYLQYASPSFPKMF